MSFAVRMCVGVGRQVSSARKYVALRNQAACLLLGESSTRANFITALTRRGSHLAELEDFCGKGGTYHVKL